MDTRIVLENGWIIRELPAIASKEIMVPKLTLRSYSQPKLYIEANGFKSTIKWIEEKYRQVFKNEGRERTLYKMIGEELEFGVFVLAGAVGQFLQKHPDCIIESFAIGTCRQLSDKINRCVLLFANSNEGKIGAVYISFDVWNTETHRRFTSVIPYDEGIAFFEDGQYVLVTEKGSYKLNDSYPWIVELNELITLSDLKTQAQV
uniref:Uncharacterized protein n=1 Tax=Pseudothermotoga hypogea TaxID=57487 RepID=A0A832MPL9_9THEM